MTKIRRGKPSSSPSVQAAWVCASMPSTALTTSIMRSTTEHAARTSPKKSAKPGVSMRLSLTSSTLQGARANDMDMWDLISSGSKSLTVVPSSTLPGREMVPVAKRSDSASVVLPEPLCPTRATLRTPVRDSWCEPFWPGGPGGAGSGLTCPTRATSVALMGARQAPRPATEHHAVAAFPSSGGLLHNITPTSPSLTVHDNSGHGAPGPATGRSACAGRHRRPGPLPAARHAAGSG